MVNSIEKIGIKIDRQFGVDGEKKKVDPRDVRLREATKNFEKIFVTQMIKDMWKTIEKEEDSKMPGEDIYMEMIQSSLSNELVKGKGIGIADMLYRQVQNGLGKGKTIEKIEHESDPES